MAMAGKILRQLGVFYGPWRCAAYNMSKRISLAQTYEKSLASFAPQRRKKMKSLSADARLSLALRSPPPRACPAAPGPFPRLP